MGSPLTSVRAGEGRLGSAVRAGARQEWAEEWKQLCRQLFGELGCDREARDRGQPEVDVGFKEGFLFILLMESLHAIEKVLIKREVLET